MGLVSENRTHLMRYRQLPCVGACGLRQCRYAFTSHSFSSCPMHREQRGEPRREPRRAPSSIHRLIMDNKLARRGHPASRASGTHYKVTLSGGELPPFGCLNIQRAPEGRKSPGMSRKSPDLSTLDGSSSGGNRIIGRKALYKLTIH